MTVWQAVVWLWLTDLCRAWHDMVCLPIHPRLVPLAQALGLVHGGCRCCRGR